jgi:hypothetical protein
MPRGRGAGMALIVSPFSPQALHRSRWPKDSNVAKEVRSDGLAVCRRPATLRLQSAALKLVVLRVCAQQTVALLTLMLQHV